MSHELCGWRDAFSSGEARETGARSRMPVRYANDKATSSEIEKLTQVKMMAEVTAVRGAQSVGMVCELPSDAPAATDEPDDDVAVRAAESRKDVEAAAGVTRRAGAGARMPCSSSAARARRRRASHSVSRAMTCLYKGVSHRSHAHVLASPRGLQC